MIRRVFIDTNCFLHLRDLKDLPWGDVLQGVTELEILIAPIVIDELDRLKVEKGGRIRDRSRAALDLIASATLHQPMQIVLREAPLHIRLVISEAHPIDWASHPRLDSNRPDDHLIAATLTEPGPTPLLLTFDTGPFIRARTIGLAAIRAPETWALPPQRDEAEQKIARLERELAAARSTRPTMLLSLPDLADDGVLRLNRPSLEPLPQSFQERLLHAVLARHPMEELAVTRDEPFGINLGLGSITRSQVDRYRHEYSTFVDRQRRQFAELHNLMYTALNFGEVRYELFNDSAVTATNVRVTIGCGDGLRLFGSRSELANYGGALRRHEPPDPPSEYGYISSLHNLVNQRPERDPTAFYWLDRPVAGSSASLVSDEFRATWRRSYSIYAAARASDDTEVTVEVSATNLPSPVSIQATVQIISVEGSWKDPAVLRRLPAWIAEMVEVEDQLT